MAFNYFGVSATHAATYAKFRPVPPNALIQRILQFITQGGGSLNTAVDVGCGSGQSTHILYAHFKKVFGVDPSHEIIKEANKLSVNYSNVEFRVGGAESLPLEDLSVDLVTTVQAVHWFNLPKFYSEVDRILKKNGVFAIYGYNLPMVVGNNDASQLIRKYYLEKLKDYILDGSRKVYLNNYSDPEFNEVPFVSGAQMTRTKDFVSQMPASVSELIGYMSSWSGFQNLVKMKGQAEGERVLGECEKEMCKILHKTPGDNIQISYKYFLLVGRKE